MASTTEALVSLSLVAAYALGVAWVAAREREAMRAPSVRAVAVVLLVSSFAVTAWVVNAVLRPTPALASSELAAGKSLPVPASDGLVEVTARGRVQGGGVGEGHYVLDVRSDDGSATQRIEGTFEEHAEQRRVARRSMTKVQVGHLEHHHLLEPTFVGKSMQITLTSTDGRIEPTVDIAVAAAPPRERLVVGVLVLLTLLGGALARKVSHLAIVPAMLASLCFLLLEAPRPVETGTLFRIETIAIVIGLFFAAAVGSIGSFVGNAIAARKPART